MFFKNLKLSKKFQTAGIKLGEVRTSFNRNERKILYMNEELAEKRREHEDNMKNYAHLFQLNREKESICDEKARNIFRELRTKLDGELCELLEEIPSLQLEKRKLAEEIGYYPLTKKNNNFSSAIGVNKLQQSKSLLAESSLLQKEEMIERYQWIESQAKNSKSYFRYF